MALHQVQARSPDRTRRLGEADDRYYQSVNSFAVAPIRLCRYHEVQLEVSDDQVSRLSTKMKLPMLYGTTQPVLPVHEYTNGSLRFRVRCCRLRSEEQTSEAAWTASEMLWPEHIFVHFNDHKLAIRRGTHNGKDLPIELTEFVVAGTNTLKVALPLKGPTAGDKKGNLFYLAVEIIETLKHSEIVGRVEANGRLACAETLGKIRSRLNAAPDEDGIAVIDRTGKTANELSIDLTDPFTSKIFTVPVRGAHCTHMECFDLETWLATRPMKTAMKCSHKDICTCPKRLGPSEPDRWKCPHCDGDARPGSLRIDSFLEGVRGKLEEMGKLHTKSILAAADGTWRPVEEPDDDDEGSDGDGPHNNKRRSVSVFGRPRLSQRHSASMERAPVEVIELD